MYLTTGKTWAWTNSFSGFSLFNLASLLDWNLKSAKIFNYIFLKKIIHFIGATTQIFQELNPLPAMDRKGGTNIKESKCISSMPMLHELASHNLIFTTGIDYAKFFFTKKSILQINIRSLSWSLGDTATNHQNGNVWRPCCCPLEYFLCLPCCYRYH